MAFMKNAVVMNKLGECVELVLGRDVDFSIAVLLNAIMIDASVISQADASLTWRTFALAHQETSINARAEEIFGRVSRDWPVIPRMLFERVQWRDVVRWHPTNMAGIGMCFTPLARFVVGQNSDLFALSQAQLILATRLEVIERDEQLRIVVFRRWC